MKKIIKILLIEIFIIILVFSYFVLKNNNANFSTVHKSLDNLENLDTIQVKEVVNIRHKDALYKDLEQALLYGKGEVSLLNSSLFKNPNEIFKILEDISYNNPKVMYYKGAKYSFGKLELSYFKPGEEILEHQREIEKVKQSFLQNHINTSMSDYEKALEIHDFIIERGEYDKRLLTDGQVPPESYSSYGVLSLGVGVCESYAKAMKYLLDACGLNSLIVVGESKGESHAWNLVELDGEYYHVDSTWNDPISDDGEDILRHNFFNLNDQELSITHEWDKGKYPEARGEKYNYYVYNDLIVNGKKQLEDQIENALLSRRTIYIAKVLNFTQDIKINEIVEKLGHKYYKEIGLNAYYYSIDEIKGIISIKFFYN